MFFDIHIKKLSDGNTYIDLPCCKPVQSLIATNTAANITHVYWRLNNGRRRGTPGCLWRMYEYQVENHSDDIRHWRNGDFFVYEPVTPELIICKAPRCLTWIQTQSNTRDIHLQIRRSSHHSFTPAQPYPWRPAITPPSTDNTVPVIHDAFADAKNRIASATSAG